MIDAEMYGMMPRPKIVLLPIFEAENRATICITCPRPP